VPTTCRALLAALEPCGAFLRVIRGQADSLLAAICKDRGAVCFATNRLPSIPPEQLPKAMLEYHMPCEERFGRSALLREASRTHGEPRSYNPPRRIPRAPPPHSCDFGCEAVLPAVRSAFSGYLLLLAGAQLQLSAGFLQPSHTLFLIARPHFLQGEQPHV
jgi:hypothetical protein